MFKFIRNFITKEATDTESDDAPQDIYTVDVWENDEGWAFRVKRGYGNRQAVLALAAYEPVFGLESSEKAEADARAFIDEIVARRELAAERKAKEFSFEVRV